jgi:hypothetical protein
MNGTKPEKQTVNAATWQKAFLFCGTLLICTLVYLVVNSVGNNRSAAIATIVTPIPQQSAAPTPQPELRQAVVLDRLNEAGLALEQNEDSSFSVSADKGVSQYSLKLYLHDGYVQGFSLTLPALPAYKASKKMSAVEKAAAERLKKLTDQQDSQLRDIVPKLLNSLSEDNYFSPSVSLAWADMAIKTRDSGKSAQDSQQGFSFFSFLDKDSSLTLSADLQ